MLSFNRRRPFLTRSWAMTAVLGLSLILGACGYRPLYGQQSGTSGSSNTVAALAQIDVKPIENRSGQKMRTALQRRLSPKGRSSSLYYLSVELSEGISDLAIDRTAFATRANLSLTAQYQLIRNADGLKMNVGSLTAVSSYNVLTSDFATHAAQTDARSRAIETLAEDIHAHLAIYFAGPAAEGIQPKAAQPATPPSAKPPVQSLF